MGRERCKILRLTELGKLISADVFEQNFKDVCSTWADIHYEEPQLWLEKITTANPHGQGISLQCAQKVFADILSGYHFVSPGYNGFRLLPLLAFLRTTQPLKILFIAHAPVQHIVELSLVKDVLRPGDVIVCPSMSARNVLCSYSADFARYITVIPHCINTPSRSVLPAASAGQPQRLVTIGRITEDKLLHRQIDALAILREQGIDNVIMEIAGPCHDDKGKPLQYVNELKARVRRLGLEKLVVFRGALLTSQEKSAFFADAAISICLSRAEEESFGKSCAESVAMGVPVITTNWNGLPETVGKCGEILPLYQLEGRHIFDVDPIDCAKAIIKLLIQPPAKADFSAQEKLFSPISRGLDYQNALQPPSASNGKTVETWQSSEIFSLIPAIRAISPIQRRDMYLSSLGILSENIASETDCHRAAKEWGILENLTFHSIRARGKELLANQCITPPSSPVPEKLRELLACSGEIDEELSSILLGDCLGECDSWARGLTLSSLTAKSLRLAPWALAVLHHQTDFPFFLLVAEVNKLQVGGDLLGAARLVQHHLTGRNLGENDVALLLYFLEVCQQASCVTLMTDILENWLSRYPDAPQCSKLWLVLATNLIIHEENPIRGKEALAQVERIIPGCDTNNLRSALISLEYI